MKTVTASAEGSYKNSLPQKGSKEFIENIVNQVVIENRFRRIRGGQIGSADGCGPG